MAVAGSLFHSSVAGNCSCGPGTQSGENVGVWGNGGNDPAVFHLLVASPAPRANLLGPYREIGSAWVVASSGQGYVAVEFR